MNSSCISVMTLLAALAISAQMPPQTQTIHFRRYKLIDMRTLGGPFSGTNFAVDVNDRAANRQVSLGFAATATPKLPHSHPLICGGDDGFGQFITHAFRWQNGHIKGLGALPPERTNCSNAYQVNADREIVGFSENGELDPTVGFNQSRAVRWRDGGIEDLGSFGGNQNAANAINNRGQIAGNSQNTKPDPFSCWGPSSTQCRAFRWQDGVMEDLGTLGGNDARAVYINERGQIAGFSYTSTVPDPVTGVPPLEPFLWEDGKMISLGTLGGAVGLFSGQGGGLNNRGEVIGVSSIAAEPAACFTEFSGNCDPFLWKDGKLIDLFESSIGGRPFTAEGINDAGEIVGMADFPTEAIDAYLWRNGKAIDLGIPDHDCFTAAEAINSHTQIVGYSFSCPGFLHHAFLWEKGAIVDLNNLIQHNSPLELVGAEDINGRGEILGEGVPRGINPSNVRTQGHAFLLIPVCADGSEGCADAPLDPAALAKTRTAATDMPKTITAEQRAAFKHKVLRLIGRNRGFGFWPRK